MRRDAMRDIKRTKAKGRVYYYFRTGQKTPAGKEILTRLPDMKDPGFWDSYAACQGAKTRRANAPRELTVPDLIDLYERSPHFRKLSAGTQRIYRIYLKQFRDLLPTAPAGRLEQSDIALLIDKKAETPGAANSLLRTVNALYKWARKRGHVANHPGKEIEELETGEHAPWSVPILNAALASDDDRVRLATHLLYYTALRIGDVVALRWSDIRGGVIHVTPQKTKRTRGEMMIPVHSELARELARHKQTSLTILGGVGQQRLRVVLQEFGAAHNVKLVPHGLRKNAVSALLEAGCSVAETAAISGQTLAMVEHYAKSRDQGKLASAAILRWQKNA